MGNGTEKSVRVCHTNFMKFKVFARLNARVCVFVKGGPDSSESLYLNFMAIFPN